MWTLLLVPSAMARPAPIDVRTSAALPHSVFAPGEPILVQLRIENMSDKPLTLDAFIFPPCFVEAYLSITLDPKAPSKTRKRACKPAVVEVAPTKALEMQVDLRTLFEVGPTHTVELDWKLPASMHLTSSAVQVGPFSVRKPLKTASVDKGEDLVLPAGTFTFQGHSHKSTMAGGPESPLMVNYRWAPTKGEAVEDTAYLFTGGGENQFSVGPYVLERVAHAYGRSMTLRIFP